MAKKKKRWLKIIIISVVILAVGGMILANLLNKKDTSTEVMTEKVKTGKLVQTIPGTGRVNPEIQVKISAKVAGEITHIYVEEGDRVKKGDLLVRLDRERYEASVEQARSSQKSAEAASEKANSELRRIKELYQRGMSSESDLESAQAEFQYRSAEVERSQAFLKQANDDLAKTSIYSPMYGIVSVLNKEPGEMVLGAQYSQDVILIVADLNKMEVVVEVDENDIINVELQDTATVKIDAYPDTTFQGVVREIAHTALTRGLGTAEEITNFVVKVTLLDVPQSLRPGMSATADIITEIRENVLHIPIQCVVLKPPISEEEEAEEEAAKDSIALEEDLEEMEKPEEELIEVVFLVEENTAHQMPVTTGISSDTDIEIISGLEDGDAVVSGPFRTLTQRLKDGDEVKEKKKPKSSDEDS